MSQSPSIARRLFPWSIGRLAGACFALVWCATLGACVAVVGDGCQSGSEWSEATVRKDVIAEIEHVAGKPLSVETENGAVVVERSTREGVRVAATISARTQERLDLVRLTLDRERDGTLAVRLEWPQDGRRSNEGASVRVEIPDAAGLDLRTSNGRVASAGLGGDARIQTSNGAIVVRDHAGEVDGSTSNGRVELEGVGGARVVTSNGSVGVTLRDDANLPVTIETSNGSVRFVVGSAFRGAINAQTSNGSVRADCPHATSKSTDRASGRVVFGDGPTSTIGTSNGSVIISER
jgi:hypothetical protein